MKKQLLSEEFTRMQKLAGIISEIKIVPFEHNPNSTDSAKLFDFPDNNDDVRSYKELGFNVVIDDEYNEVYYAEMSFKGYDWMAVLWTLIECKNYNLSPTLEYKEELYDFDEAYELADQKAADDEYNEEGIGKSSEEF
jgi:hypothetical protein